MWFIIARNQVSSLFHYLCFCYGKLFFKNVRESSGIWASALRLLFYLCFQDSTYGDKGVTWRNSPRYVYQYIPNLRRILIGERNSTPAQCAKLLWIKADRCRHHLIWIEKKTKTPPPKKNNKQTNNTECKCRIIAKLSTRKNKFILKVRPFNHKPQWKREPKKAILNLCLIFFSAVMLPIKCKFFFFFNLSRKVQAKGSIGYFQRVLERSPLDTKWQLW